MIFEAILLALGLVLAVVGAIEPTWWLIAAGFGCIALALISQRLRL